MYAHALLNLWTGTRQNYVALFDMDEYMVIDPRGKRIEDLGRECWPDYAEIHLHRQVPCSCLDAPTTCTSPIIGKGWHYCTVFLFERGHTGLIALHIHVVRTRRRAWGGCAPCDSYTLWTSVQGRGIMTNATWRVQGTTCEDHASGCSVAKNPGRWFNRTEGLIHPIQKFTEISGGTGMLKA